MGHASVHDQLIRMDGRTYVVALAVGLGLVVCSAKEGVIHAIFSVTFVIRVRYTRPGQEDTRKTHIPCLHHHSCLGTGYHHKTCEDMSTREKSTS